MVVEIIDENDPPYILDIPDIYVHYDENYEYDFSYFIHDPDNDPSELTIWTSSFLQGEYEKWIRNN